MPIKIATRFATVRDTAKALGVPKRRSDKLVELVKESLGDYKLATPKDARTAGGHQIKRKASKKSAWRSNKQNAATTRTTATKAKR